MAETAVLHAALSEKQRETLVAIDALQRELGYSPTVREIQARTFSSSPSNIHDRLVILRDYGLVTWVEDSPRTLVLTKEGRRAL
jgi:SOS-response transcriptional repressor LexA